MFSVKQSSSDCSGRKCSICLHLAFESIVFLVTVWKTWSLVRDAKRAELSSDTVARCLMLNGSLYYLACVSLQLIVFVTWNAPISNITAIKVYNVSNEITYPLRYALISKFMLDLRERAGKRTDSQNPTTLQTVTTFHAATLKFFQNTVDRDFGEPLDLAGSDWQVEEEEGIELEESRDSDQRQNATDGGGEIRFT